MEKFRLDVLPHDFSGAFGGSDLTHEGLAFSHTWRGETGIFEENGLNFQ